MRNTGLDEAQAEIKIAGWNINNLRYADVTTLMAESEEPLDESERREWKSWLKLNIQITKIIASGPITSWQIDGETVKAVADFILGGSKMKGWSQSKNHTQLWMWLVIEARPNAVKSNSA